MHAHFALLKEIFNPVLYLLEMLLINHNDAAIIPNKYDHSTIYNDLYPINLNYTYFLLD